MKIAFIALLQFLATVSMGASPDELFWRFSFENESGFIITNGTQNSIATATPSYPTRFAVVDVYVTESAYGLETRSWRHGNLSRAIADSYLHWDGNSVYEISSLPDVGPLSYLAAGDVVLTLIPSQSRGMATRQTDVIFSSPLTIVPVPHQKIDRLDVSFQHSGDSKKRIGEGLVERFADRQRMSIDLKRGRSEEIIFTVKSTSDWPFPLSMKMTGRKLPCSVQYYTPSYGLWSASKNFLIQVYKEFGILKARDRFIFKMKLRPKVSTRQRSGQLTFSANPRLRYSQKDQVIVDIAAPSPVALPSVRRGVQ